jgi:hypothetical protein
MIYATLQSFSKQNANTFAMRKVVIVPQAAITSVTGPAHTAAIFVTYSSGTNGIEGTTVALDGVKIIASANANYVLNGVYLNDATNAWVHDFQETGKVTSFDNTTSGIVYDGTHAPTNLHV